MRVGQGFRLTAVDRANEEVQVVCDEMPGERSQNAMGELRFSPLDFERPDHAEHVVSAPFECPAAGARIISQLLRQSENLIARIGSKLVRLVESAGDRRGRDPGLSGEFEDVHFFLLGGFIGCCLLALQLQRTPFCFSWPPRKEFPIFIPSGKQEFESPTRTSWPQAFRHEKYADQRSQRSSSSHSSSRSRAS